MEKTKIFDEEFKQKVSDGCEKIKEKLSDALLTEEGKLDTEKIGNAARETAKNVEAGVKEGSQKFKENFVKEDGKLDKEKVGSALGSAYRRAGRFLATATTRLGEILSDKFGMDGEKGDIFDTEVVEQPEQDV